MSVEDWQNFRVKDLGAIVTGKTPTSKRPELFGDAYPFITPTEMGYGERTADPVRFLSEEGAASQRRLLLPSGTVSFVCIASIGKACLIREPSFTNQQVNSVIVDEERHSPEFLYYLLVSHRDRIKRYASGAATPIINKGDFGEIELTVPPLVTQQHIAAILSAYDDLIENNTRRITILEEMARRLYEEWFVHFRFLGHEEVEFIEVDGQSQPSNWAQREVKDIVKRLKNGTVYKQKDVASTGSTMVIDQSRAEYLGFHENVADHEASASCPIIIFGDHTCKMQIVTIPFSLGPNTVAFTSAASEALYYLYALVQGAVETREYKRHWTELIKRKVLVANPDLARRYDETVRPMFSMMETLREQSRNLRAQRDLLLPKLVSGEINVSGTEAELKAAE